MDFYVPLLGLLSHHFKSHDNWQQKNVVVVKAPWCVCSFIQPGMWSEQLVRQLCLLCFQETIKSIFHVQLSATLRNRPVSDAHKGTTLYAVVTADVLRDISLM